MITLLLCGIAVNLMENQKRIGLLKLNIFSGASRIGSIIPPTENPEAPKKPIDPG